MAAREFANGTVERVLEGLGRLRCGRLHGIEHLAGVVDHAGPDTGTTDVDADGESGDRHGGDGTHRAEAVAASGTARESSQASSRLIAVRATTCCSVTARCPRVRPRNDHVQDMAVASRLLNPTM